MSGRLSICAVVSAVWLLSGCDLDNPGVNPPLQTVNFPIALALSAPNATGAPSHLFVANSNFDLRFNAGSVHSYDLGLVEAALPVGTVERVLSESDVMVDARDPGANGEVLTSAHASGMELSPDGTRLYLAVRSDANLTYIDVEPRGSLSCGGSAKSHRCTPRFRRGDETVAAPRGIDLPTDPTGIIAGSLSDFPDAVGDGDWVMMSHRSGRMSLFLDRTGDAPQLIHVLGGLPPEIVNLQLDRDSGLVWMLSTAEARIGRSGVAWDQDPSLSFLFDAGPLVVTDVTTGEDVRDVRFDTLPDGSRAAFVLSRRPEALLVIDLDRSMPGRTFVRHAVEVGFGPSRLAVGSFDVGSATTPDERVFVFASCYDSRDVWVIDPIRGEVVNIVRGMSGPFEMVVDTARERLYVADFRASVIRVVDLRPLLDCLRGTAGDPGSCEPSVLGTIGTPRPVGDLL